MKKTLKIAALVAAAVMAMGFVSCANDDAEDLGTLLIVKDYQEKKEAEAKAAAAKAASATTTNSSSESSSSDALKQSGTFSVDITKLDFATATSGLSDTVSDKTKNGKYKITNGTTLADGYFTIVQSDTSSTTYYTNKDRSQINAIELDKQSNKSYIEFTVTGSAIVTVSASSTSSSNTSYFDIVSNNGSAAKDTSFSVKGSTAVEKSKTLSAGTYWIVVWTDTENKSLARITSLKAVQTAN